MNSSSKVIMAATMVMVVSLVMVLSLVLVLLAELYCSLLFNRRRNRHSLSLPTTTTIAAAAATTTTLNQAISSTNDPSPSSTANTNSSSPNPLNTGVLQTPKAFFKTKTKTKAHLSNFHREPSLPASPDTLREIQVQFQDSNHDDKPTASVDNFIYISNPIYSNEPTSKQTTPFETPHSSPSRLETGDSSSSSTSDEESNDITEVSERVGTPTLTPMKDLPEKACSVSLKDARSLETSASGSSSSSGSPYTSPSW